MSSAPNSAAVDDHDEKIGPGRIAAAVVFAALAIAFLVAAVIYATTPAHSLPGFMGYARTHAIHRLYAVGTALIAVAFTVAAWFALRYRSLALEEEDEAAEAAEATQAAQPAAQAALSPDADPLTGVRPVDTAQS